MVLISKTSLDMNCTLGALFNLGSDVCGALLGEVAELFERLCRVVLGQEPMTRLLGGDAGDLRWDIVFRLRIDLFDLLAHLAHRLIVIMIKR